MKLLTPLFQRSEICGYKSPTPSRESLILPCRVAVRLPTEAVRVPIREVLLLPECPRHADGKLSVEHWRGEYVGRRQENQIRAGFQVQVEVHIHGSLEFIDLDLARGGHLTPAAQACVVKSARYRPSRLLGYGRETPELTGKPETHTTFIGKGSFWHRSNSGDQHRSANSRSGPYYGGRAHRALGGVYGSLVPIGTGGSFFRLSWNLVSSANIACSIHAWVTIADSPVASSGRSCGLSYKSIRRGTTSLCGESYWRSCQIEMQFVVAPLHCVKLWVGGACDLLEYREPLACRFFLLAEQERALIHAIDGAIGGDVGSAQFGERGVEIGEVHDLVAHALGGNLARPADDEGHA